jgi:hypothetical protein
MTGLVRKASLLSACGLVLATVAMADEPSAGFHTAPEYIDLVGSNGVSPDPAGSFTVVIRDLNQVPIAGVDVIVNLDACHDVQACPTATLRGFTDASGSITFNIVGAGGNTGNAAGPGVGCAIIIADGVTIRRPTVTAYDENGAITASGVDGSDLSAWMSDFGAVATNGFKGRSDFNHDGSLGGADLSYWLTRFGSGTSVLGCP